MQAQPMMVVDDVEAASLWFQQVLGLTSGHGGPDYEMLLSEGALVAQLHRWKADEHPDLGDPGDPSRGNGVAVWFGAADVDDIARRARTHGAKILDGPLDNPMSHQREIWLRGPGGYLIVASGGPAAS